MSRFELFARVLCCAVVVCASARAQSQERETRLVRTAQGPVRGYRAPEGDLFVFYGIPYAIAPTERDKFKAPLPPPVWLQPLDAVETNVVCPQLKTMFVSMDDNKMEENCLIANVYVPDTEEKNLPVLVSVHGGGYQLGYGNMGTHKNLVMTKRIIVVNFNYRLGAHGFLCLGTDDAPGNAGMKDMVALLRWVNKNIAAFGGNPDDVTIHGGSAGSSAVDLIMLSKSAKGLFNKVIPESGANVGVWSVQLDPLQNAKNFAKKLNFTNVDDIFALGEFFRTMSFELLTSDDFMKRPDSTFGFSPCVERDTGVERFLDDSPVNILKEGKYKKLPMLYGFSNMEGIMRVTMGFADFKDRMNKKFSDFVPADLEFDGEEQREEVAKQIKEFYFGNKPVSEETISEYIDYFSDVMFAYPTLRSVKLQVEAGNDKVYLYEYSFPTDQPVPPTVTVNVRGAEHCAQSAAVFDGITLFNHNESAAPENLKKMKAVMRELWLNFMTTGAPVPEGSALPAWLPVGADRAPHMSLDETLQLRGPLLERRALFWDAIYERHYRAPVPPPQPPPRPHSEL